MNACFLRHAFVTQLTGTEQIIIKNRIKCPFDPLENKTHRLSARQRQTGWPSQAQRRQCHVLLRHGKTKGPVPRTIRNAPRNILPRGQVKRKTPSLVCSNRRKRGAIRKVHMNNSRPAQHVSRHHW